MRPFKWIETACIAASMCAALGGWAQADTVEVRVYGGQRDDRGLRLVELSDGDVLALSSSNSTTDEEPHAWIRRFESLVNPVWNATISDTPLLQPVDAVEHGAGFITFWAFARRTLRQLTTGAGIPLTPRAIRFPRRSGVPMRGTFPRGSCNATILCGRSGRPTQPAAGMCT